MLAEHGLVVVDGSSTVGRHCAATMNVFPASSLLSSPCAPYVKADADEPNAPGGAVRLFTAAEMRQMNGDDARCGDDGNENAPPAPSLP